MISGVISAGYGYDLQEKQIVGGYYDTATGEAYVTIQNRYCYGDIKENVKIPQCVILALAGLIKGR